MKEICGFLDSKGRFHKTEKSAKVAESEYKIESIEEKLNNFSEVLLASIFSGRSKIDTMEYMRNHETFKDHVLLGICRLVLHKSDDFISIINQKKELEETLDILYKEKEEYLKPWYLKFPWWKD